ncbi:MAG: hypothetical protein P0Y56_16810 [Candidatus Andeanibacterium colombiense]|uniref:Leucine-rich repeat domain-containing protein n=1 Tax=Candidatus Andeanibacterium colombiense TaxID=3121345 RepID=A0AAJ6BPG7_9SPHN|nr:MAG: hypothetical protein P0Y56_16810 [Sphingomonadaceae bacterium]
MKHHFGDELDRSYGHWTVTPNRERWAHHYPSLDRASDDIATLTLTRDDKAWKRALSFGNLTELTLHNPSQDQLAALTDFPKLAVLRITHAKPKSLTMLSEQKDLRELVLEYVSGVADLDAVGDLPTLTALHIENMRNLSDFAALGSSASLRYLALNGTPDWKQPIASLKFLGSMTAIELLRLGNVRIPEIANPFGSLLNSKTIRWLRLAMHILPLAEYARLEAALPNVDGARRPAFSKYGGIDRELSPRDIRARMPLAQFSEYTNLYVAPDGKRFERVPHQALLLGKGERHVSGAEQFVNERCDAHQQKYDALVSDFRR